MISDRFTYLTEDVGIWNAEILNFAKQMQLKGDRRLWSRGPTKWSCELILHLSPVGSLVSLYYLFCQGV